MRGNAGQRGSEEQTMHAGDARAATTPSARDERLAQAKHALREQVLAARAALSGAARAAASGVITGLLLGHPRYRAARCVAAYSAFGTEFDTGAFIRSVLGDGKALLLPRVDRSRRRLELCRVADPDAELRPGVWGILEPDPTRCEPVDAASLEFMLVPGVAFTARGERLGYGGGYYDGLIATLGHGVFKAAGAFSVQVLESLPLGPHDQRLDAVLTEAGCYSPADAAPPAETAGSQKQRP